MRDCKSTLLWIAIMIVTVAHVEAQDNTSAPSSAAQTVDPRQAKLQAANAP